MNRERAKELLPIITAFANGETVEYRLNPKNTWSGQAHNSYSFDCDGDYRIKPKEYWVNVFKRNDGSFWAGIATYGSKEEAERNGKTNAIYVRTINIGE